jgi:anti-sigma B factor antagonist
MSFSYTIQEQYAVPLLSLKGKITSDGDVQQLQEDAKLQSANLIIDLTACTHINSSGINFLIRNLTRCRIANGELVLVGVGGNVKKLFELAKIDGLFTVCETIEDSINHFNKN